MIRLKITKRARFTSHMLASGAFIALFIWGWDLPVSEALHFALLLLLGLALLLGFAAALGLLLARLSSRRAFSSVESIESPPKVAPARELRDGAPEDSPRV